jgi:hypothetical protein
MHVGIRHAGLFLLCLACAARATAAPDSQSFAPEVFRDRDLAVHAGIAAPDGQIVHFGDVLSLVVVISWNAAELSLETPGEDFFASAWSGGHAPPLLDRRDIHGPGRGGFTDELRSVFRFQIVACPAEKATCPGDRTYELPEFALRYREQGGAPVTVTFQPEPRTLTVMTAIARDAADQLLPFSSYFSSGAWPDPAVGTDRTRAWLAALGTGFLVFVGGVFMWPFRFRRQQLFAEKEMPRWREVLLELQHEEDADERRLADRMRRCLVWYCTDSLGVDPFDWLAAADDEVRSERHAKLRALFLDLLHDPTGRGPELRSRLAALVAEPR